MATTKDRKPTGFDLGLFERMVAPLRIRIERKNPRTGLMEPIPLPQDQWSKEDAEKIEQIVLNDISGGGSYAAQMTDANGIKLDWAFSFPTDFYPTLIPPGSASAIGSAGPVPVAAVQAQQAQQAQAVQAAQWQRGQYGLPVQPPTTPFVAPYQQQPYGQQYGQPQYPQQVYPPVPYGMQPSPFGYPSQYPSQWPPYQPPPITSTPRSSEGSAQLDHMRQQLEAQKQAAQEERFARERSEAEARHREQLAQIQTKQAEEMRALRESIAEQRRAVPVDDPKIALLQQQIEEQKRANERLEADRRQQEAEMRHRDELRALKESSDKQFEAMREMMREMKEAAGKGTDPQMTMMLEIQRQQAEAQREQARTSAENARESLRLASEQPRQQVEMFARLREAGGAEQMLSQMNMAWQGLMTQQAKVMEMVMNMGPSPGMAIAEGVMGTGKEILDAYMTSKRDESIAKERTAQMQAQRDAATAQAQATIAYAQTQPVYRDENGNIKGQPPTREQLAGAEAAAAAEPAPPTAPANGRTKESAIWGNDDVFGEVKRLREAYEADEIEPEQVAQFVILAAMEIQKNQMVVPAFTLYAEQRFAELIDLLLPKASSEFNGECVEEMVAKMKELGLSTPGAAHVDLDDKKVPDEVVAN